MYVWMCVWRERGRENERERERWKVQMHSASLLLWCVFLLVGSN